MYIHMVESGTEILLCCLLVSGDDSYAAFESWTQSAYPVDDMDWQLGFCGMDQTLRTGPRHGLGVRPSKSMINFFNTCFCLFILAPIIHGTYF